MLESVETYTASEQFVFSLRACVILKILFAISITIKLRYSHWDFKDYYFPFNRSTNIAHFINYYNKNDKKQNQKKIHFMHLSSSHPTVHRSLIENYLFTNQRKPDCQRYLYSFNKNIKKK